MGEGVVHVLVRFTVHVSQSPCGFKLWSVLLLPITAPSTAITALQEREAGAAARHSTAGTSYYAPNDRENYQAGNNYRGNDRPPTNH
jgi:hypothetical protein